MCPRSSIIQTELSSLGFLNIEYRVKHLYLQLNHAHKSSIKYFPRNCKGNLAKN